MTDPRIDPACKASVQYKSSGACDGFPNPCSMCDCFFTSEFADQERAAVRYILAAADAVDPVRADLLTTRAQIDEIRLLAEAAKASVPNAPYTGLSWQRVFDVLDGSGSCPFLGCDQPNGHGHVWPPVAAAMGGRPSD